MDLEDILKFQNLQENDVPAYHITGAVKREPGGGAAVDTIAVPIGAIIGIAVVGSAILFGVLTMAITHFLRSRYSHKKRPRDLDLSDDNEENIDEALKSTRPPKIGLETRISHKQSHSETDFFPAEWPGQRFYGPQLDNSRSMPPAYAFQITGLRDSWPLVGWVQSPSNMPQAVNKYPIINSTNIDRRASHSAFMLSVDNEPSWPQPTFSRSSSFTRSNDRRSVQWPDRSAKSSITSLKRISTNQKSASDSQLTSILRSTSQRLRHAQCRPISHRLSVLGQVSSTPPATKPMTPPRYKRRESCEALIGNDGESSVDSVRSSVLNTTSHTPSPQKRAERAIEPAEGNEKALSPTTIELSETDSLCLSKTPDLFIPATLSSPAKEGERTDQRYEMAISTVYNSPTRTYQGKGRCSAALANISIKANTPLFNSISPSNDPFLSFGTTTKPRFNSKLIKGPRPLTKRSATVQPDSDANEHGNAFSPLGVVSGNSKPPAKWRPASMDSTAEIPINPFHWSPQCPPSLVLTPSQKSTGIRQRGHRRSRTVRLSNLSRPLSVSVVFEEPENESTPPPTDVSTNTPATLLSSPQGDAPATVAHKQGSNTSPRPPSIPVFQPLFTMPSTSDTEDGAKLSNGSSPATISSIYDYYSSGEPLQFTPVGISGPNQSPTPSTKKARRKGCDFSDDITQARDVALWDDSTFELPSDRALPPSKSAPTRSSHSDTSCGPAAAPTFIPQTCGPTSPQPLDANDSITASISMLRRMNSQVSTYSASSFLSDNSKGSPAIPATLGGGITPTKRKSQGTINYLSIGAKTSSLKANSGRRQDSMISGKGRDCHQGLVFGDSLENHDALGLRMPILENSSPRPPLLESTVSVDGKENESPTKPQSKVPAAQLQAMSSFMPQRDIREIPNAGENVNRKEIQDTTDWRWPKIMSPPLKKSIRHESQLDMPSPKDPSPKSTINWRDSGGLYDERGFFKEFAREKPTL